MAASFYININNVWKCQSFPFLSDFLLSILTATLTATTGLCWLLMWTSLHMLTYFYISLKKMSDLLLISHLSYVFVLLSCKSAGNRLQIKSLLIYHLFSCSLLSSHSLDGVLQIPTFPILTRPNLNCFICFGLLTTYIMKFFLI